MYAWFNRYQYIHCSDCTLSVFAFSTCACSLICSVLYTMVALFLIVFVFLNGTKKLIIITIGVRNKNYWTAINVWHLGGVTDLGAQPVPL